MTMHLVYLQEPWLSQVLDGRKRVEHRVSKSRQPWWQTVERGDLLLFCRRGRVHGLAEVQTVEWFSGPAVAAEMRRRFGTDAYWDGREGLQYAAAIHFDEVVRLDEPMPAAHGAPASGWRLCA